MKRLLNVGIVVATLGAITVFAGRSGANNPPADKPALVVAETAARNPWTKLELHQGADAFRFAVVSDRTGGHRPGIFSRAVRMINLLQPEFAETFGQPLRAPALAERRRGDRHQLLLPLHHPAIVQVEPLERRMNARQRSQLADAGKS